MKENEKTAYQNLWDAVKTVFGGKFTVVNWRKEERSQTNNLTFPVKKVKKMWIYYTLTKEKEGNNKNWSRNKNRKINFYINK